MELEPITIHRELDTDTGEVLYALEHPEEMNVGEVLGALIMVQHSVLSGKYEEGEGDGQA